MISCSPGFSRGKPELEELPDGTIVDVELMFKEVLPGGDNLSRAILLGFHLELLRINPWVSAKERYISSFTLSLATSSRLPIFFQCR